MTAEAWAPLGEEFEVRTDAIELTIRDEAGGGMTVTAKSRDGVRLLRPMILMGAEQGTFTVALDVVPVEAIA
ncbi:MAG: hypothetical protein WAN48_10720 [Actinomycetes bacterium]